ncbi:MAG: hypothetical protein LBR85_01380 [Oscillospiraceae bacterium]|jgi:spore germination protein KC|nr:hypothetical protein [Oscillospiraceae bacterium]
MRALRAALPALAFAILCGCVNYSELKNVDIVAGMGVDSVPEGYALTIEILDVSGSTDESAMNSKLVKSRGATFANALESARSQLSGNLYFGNTQIVIVGQTLAEDEGVSQFLEWLLSKPEIRETANMAVARGTAEGVLAAKSADARVSAYSVIQLIDPQDGKREKSGVPLYRIAEAVNTPGKPLKLPLVILRDDSGAGVKGEEGVKIIELHGFALFDGDRLCGFSEGGAV